MTNRGPEIVLSRSSQMIVREIFKQEIPEINEGTIVVKGIAREAGYRSKVAVLPRMNPLTPLVLASVSVAGVLILLLKN